MCSLVILEDRHHMKAYLSAPAPGGISYAIYGPPCSLAPYLGSPPGEPGGVFWPSRDRFAWRKSRRWGGPRVHRNRHVTGWELWATGSNPRSDCFEKLLI